jgi:hypothetical protein
MKSFWKVILWFPATVLCLVFSLISYSRISATTNFHGLLRQEFSDLQHNSLTFAALPRTVFEIKTALATEDARPLVINRYFKRYGSPMEGMGDYIVKTADHFNVDPYLVVAIAQQESNLGKITPPSCYNAWGWGIHTAGTLCFDSWQEGINTFTEGLSEKYLAYGLHTPEEIMTRYNATSPGGSWAKGVSQFLNELQTGDF